MPEPVVLLFSQNLDYFRPYKNQVNPGYIITYKGNPIEIMVKLLLDHLVPFWTIEDHLRKFKTILYGLGPFYI